MCILFVLNWTIFLAESKQHFSSLHDRTGETWELLDRWKRECFTAHRETDWTSVLYVIQEYSCSFCETLKLSLGS